MSRHIIEELYEEDLAEAIHSLLSELPWVADLDVVRQRVLVDMTFNLGIGKLLKFHDTLDAIQSGRYADAAVHMANSLWAKQTKRRAAHLCHMMATGEDYV